MFSLLFLFFFILGAFIGSFLNVVIYRYNTGMSVAHGRSQCLSCGKTLAWYELIPIFSFLFQRGKCRGCGVSISWQYPFVEIATAILFGFVFARQYALYPFYSSFSHGLLYSLIFLFFYFSIISLLLVISVYDFRHKIIPDSLVYWFIGLSLAKLLIFSFICLPMSGISALSFPYIFDLFAPIIFFVPVWLLWLISRGTWIGFGDAKLVIGIGALLGFVSGLSAIVLGIWIGAAVCLVCMAIEKFFPGRFGGLRATSEIPLAPFLILGVYIVLFTHVDVLGIASYFGM